MNRSVQMPCIATAMAAFLATSSGTAVAAAPGDLGNDGNYVTYDPGPTLRRGGFTMGLESGTGVSSFSGFPNEVAKLNDPRFERNTGVGLGTDLSLWLGGALRDWVTVGLGATLATARGNGALGSGIGFLVHVEAFPLFYEHRHLRHLGIGFSGGVGFAQMFDEDTPDPLDPIADGGAMSVLSWSVFYEPWRFWHFSAGPTVSYTHSFSQSLTIHQALAGFRLVFYGVQP